MSDFLNFLNTAEIESLTKTPGISNAIAENIISARPFESVDDCLKVKGMGKNLLARMQSTFEAGEKPSESNAIIQVTEEAPPAPIEKSRPAQESPVEKGPSFGSRLGQAFLSFVRALFRLIALALVLLGIGAAIYFGVPFINNNVVVPIQRNTSQINQLENQIATLQSQLDEMNTRVSGIESTIEAQTASIAKLDEMQATLEQEATKQNNSVLIALKREVMLTRSIETIARARLFLSQSNFGLARDDVQAARDILAELLVDAPAYQVDSLSQIIMRLDLALGNLPAFPVIAVDDVDIAWQLLMMGLPESPAEATITVGTITVTFTFTPTPPPVFTPTLVPDLTATPTAVP
ncbi:MAG: helix-hairpin-helix domain-containing protein [Chloroflexi bacterium]|nr:helix-hairpin-helix domain-containing protein [Chloroflexota bacterium]